MNGPLGAAVKGLLARLRGAHGTPADPRSDRGEVIRGTAGNAIIVKSPDTEYFKEAIFILREDALTRSGVSRKQILRDAKRAAGAYTASRVPRRSRAPVPQWLCFLLGAATCLAVQWLVTLL